MNVTLQILPTNVKWNYMWNIYGHLLVLLLNRYFYSLGMRHSKQTVTYVQDEILDLEYKGNKYAILMMYRG